MMRSFALSGASPILSCHAPVIRGISQRWRICAVVIASIPLLLLLSPAIRAQPPAGPPAAKRYVTSNRSIPPDPRAINDEGVVIGPDSVVYKDRTVQLLGPLLHGANSVLVALNNRGQVLVGQADNGPHYFLYDPLRDDMTPIGLNARVQEGAATRTFRLAYLTGLTDAGEVYGVYGNGHGPCGVIGRPTYGAANSTDEPTTPADFTLVGCPGGGDLHIRAINSRGQITGGVNREGFVWSAGKLSVFDFPGSLGTEGVAINDEGVVAGEFMVGNAISETGEVSAQFTPGLPPPQKGFTYDGHQFRLLFMQRGTPIHVTGINNRGQVTGHFITEETVNKGFVVDSSTLPVAHMQPTAAELTAAAVADWEASSTTSQGALGQGTDESPVDRAYDILARSAVPGAASTLRALEALTAAGTLASGNRVREIVTSNAGSTEHYISVEALRGRVMQGISGTLIAQFAAMQQSDAGRKSLVEALAALDGRGALELLRAAGELAPTGPAARPIPQNQLHAAARAELAGAITTAIAATLNTHPLEMPPAHLERWHLGSASPRQFALFDSALRMIQERFGAPTAATFLAWSENGQAKALFMWQAVEQLITMNTRGEQAQAEQALCALAPTPSPVPSPASCPGLGSLRRSGTFGSDQYLNLLPDANPRIEVASAVGQMGEQLFAQIRNAGEPAVATAPASAPSGAPASRVIREPMPSPEAPGRGAADERAQAPVAPRPTAPRPPANPIASPAALLFSGTHASLQGDALSFTLSAPTDRRDGQTLQFRSLVPMPGAPGKVWIAEDQDGYVVFSLLGNGALLGQVLPSSSGAAVYEKALRAQGGS